MKQIGIALITILVLAGSVVIGDLCNLGWKTRALEVGQVWVADNEDPFLKTHPRTVIDIKDGYVQYSYGSKPIIVSIRDYYFVINSKRVDKTE